jgi:integrase
MACIRERRGRWVLDYRDASGKRRWRSYPLTEAGKACADNEARRQSGLKGTPVDPDVTVGVYARQWLDLVRARVGEPTWSKYEIVTRVHLGPLHGRRVADLQRPVLKRYLAGLVSQGTLKRSTVGKVLAVTHNMLAEAVDEGLLESNPAAKLGRHLGIPATFDPEQIRAMDWGQLQAFLAAARAHETLDVSLALWVLAYAGLRIGELLGLRLEDVQDRLAVERQIRPDGQVALPKGKRSRRVDIATDLQEAIDGALAARREHELRAGTRSPWLVLADLDVASTRPRGLHRVHRAMARVLKAAALPGHFTPHCLRHTYASLLLSRGESLLYVSRQLGHSTIKLTADLYGRWLPVEPTNGGPNLLSRRRVEDCASLSTGRA